MISSCVAKNEEAVTSTSGMRRTPGFIALVSMMAILVSITLSMSVNAGEASASLIKMGGWGGGQGRQQPVPQSLAHDSQGRIFIADSGTGRALPRRHLGAILGQVDAGRDRPKTPGQEAAGGGAHTCPYPHGEHR